MLRPFKFDQISTFNFVLAQKIVKLNQNFDEKKILGGIGTIFLTYVCLLNIFILILEIITTNVSCKKCHKILENTWFFRILIFVGLEKKYTKTIFSHRYVGGTYGQRKQLISYVSKTVFKSSFIFCYYKSGFFLLSLV